MSADRLSKLALKRAVLILKPLSYERIQDNPIKVAARLAKAYGRVADTVGEDAYDHNVLHIFSTAVWVAMNDFDIEKMEVNPFSRAGFAMSVLFDAIKEATPEILQVMGRREKFKLLISLEHTRLCKEKFVCLQQKLESDLPEAKGYKQRRKIKRDLDKNTAHLTWLDNRIASQTKEVNQIRVEVSQEITEKAKAKAISQFNRYP